MTLPILTLLYNNTLKQVYVSYTGYRSSTHYKSQGTPSTSQMSFLPYLICLYTGRQTYVWCVRHLLLRVKGIITPFTIKNCYFLSVLLLKMTSLNFLKQTETLNLPKSNKKVSNFFINLSTSVINVLGFSLFNRSQGLSPVDTFNLFGVIGSLHRFFYDVYLSPRALSFPPYSPSTLLVSWIKCQILIYWIYKFTRINDRQRLVISYNMWVIDLVVAGYLYVMFDIYSGVNL